MSAVWAAEVILTWLCDKPEVNPEELNGKSKEKSASISKYMFNECIDANESPCKIQNITAYCQNV